MTIGQRINLKRLQKDMSMRKLADKANIPQPTIYAWIARGTHPDIDALCKIADVFECTLDELVGRTAAK